MRGYAGRESVRYSIMIRFSSGVWLKLMGKTREQLSKGLSGFSIIYELEGAEEA